ncbi:hypothetical protein LBMAG46_08050 [Planctomycetia bacterium]|nr:hypothetical protein LBMAG46_08050 [Planctomycetia bacterium]
MGQEPQPIRKHPQMSRKTGPNQRFYEGPEQSILLSGNTPLPLRTPLPALYKSTPACETGVSDLSTPSILGTEP